MQNSPGSKLPFRILGIDHLGVAPKDIAVARKFFGQTLALADLGAEVVPSQGVQTYMYASQGGSPSEDEGLLNRLEFLAPLSGEGAIAKFLAAKGGGIHHLALRVDDIKAALAYLSHQGVELVDPVPRPGAHHSQVAFIHPRATGGILVELVEALG